MNCERPRFNAVDATAIVALLFRQVHDAVPEEPRDGLSVHLRRERGPVGHALLVGLPIALAARRFLGQG